MFLHHVSGKTVFAWYQRTISMNLHEGLTKMKIEKHYETFAQLPRLCWNSRNSSWNCKSHQVGICAFHDQHGVASSACSPSINLKIERKGSHREAPLRYHIFSEEPADPYWKQVRYASKT